MKKVSPVPISDGDKGHELNVETNLQNVNTIIHYQTPVLFSTNRGLFLRKPKSCGNNLLTSFLSKSSSGVESGESNSGKTDKYDIQFCDLERWSTNRANSITFDDTIATSQTFTLSDNAQGRSVRFVVEK